MLYISNLFSGIESGLNDPQALLDTVAPFHDQVGIEFFLHYHDLYYRRQAEEIHKWIGQLPRTVHGPFIQVEATSPSGSEGQKNLFAAYEWAFTVAESLAITKPLDVHPNL